MSKIIKDVDDESYDVQPYKFTSVHSDDEIYYAPPNKITNTIHQKLVIIYCAYILTPQNRKK